MRRGQKLRPMADRRDELAGLVEPLHEVDDALVDPQVVGRLAAGDQQRVVVVGRCVVDREIHLRLLLALVAFELFAGLPADDVDAVALLLQAIVRHAELGILETLAQQTRDLHLFRSLIGTRLKMRNRGAARKRRLSCWRAAVPRGTSRRLAIDRFGAPLHRQVTYARRLARREIAVVLRACNGYHGRRRAKGGGGAMARIFAVANQKGGVGKTTTAVNLSASLAAQERRVLLGDLDPQGKATSGLGIQRDQTDRATIYQALLGDVEARAVALPTDVPNLFLLPASGDLVGAELELVSIDNREHRLRAALPPPRAARAAARQLRLHPRRLPAVSGPVDDQRAHRRRPRAGAAAVRVLRAR